MMKTAIATFLLIFCTRFAFLHAKNKSEPNWLLDYLNPCVFNTDLVSIILHNTNNPSGLNISLKQQCNEIDKSRPVVFLIHGFISSANEPIFYNLSRALVKNYYTVFALDWSDAACYIGSNSNLFRLGKYDYAVNHTYLTSQLLANYILTLIDEYNVSPQNIVLIGHSLGSHISGFVAKKIQEIKHQNVARIIGVDPASPNFWDKECEEKLCKKDADRVFAFHSSLLGIREPIAHIDYYFNGQFTQPNCTLLDLTCSHTKSLEYLINMLNDPSCIFPGRFKEIENYNILPYPEPNETNCTILSFDIVDPTKYTTGEASYYVWVEKESPYCTKKSFKCQK